MSAKSRQSIFFHTRMDMEHTLLGSISILLELLNPCECECDCLIGDPPKLKLPSLIALCLATRSAASCWPLNGLDILPLAGATRLPKVFDRGMEPDV